jgi:F420H(2)-dependent quinone reductase
VSRATARANHALAQVGAPQRWAARLHAAAYRRTGGRLLRRWAGAPVMTIETVGRRSGRPRRTPVIHLPLEDGSFVVIPANGGSDRTPAWWINLRAAGSATVEVAGRRQRVRPRIAEGDERRELWERFITMAPSVAQYPTYTSRELPIVVLEPEPERG